MIQALILSGEFRDLVCRNHDGSVAWRIPRIGNSITNAGLDYIGSVGHCGGAQISTWYASLIGSLTSLSPGDTMSSHPGWSEFTGYSGTRPQWVNTESGRLVSSNGPFSFTITSGGTVTGMIITSSATVGGTTGTLWCTAQISPAIAVSVGQVITGTYQYSLVAG